MVRFEESLIKTKAMCKIDWNILIQSFTAFGTIAVATLAIWGNYFKYKLVPPKIKVTMSNKLGTVSKFKDGTKVIYYHLKIKNQRPWSTARSCHVRLNSISRKSENGDFKNIPIPVPPSFIWSPPDMTPLVINLSHEQTLDFGKIIESYDKFIPVLNRYPSNCNVYLEKNECIRYALEVVAEGFKTKRLHVFEVAWNGEWNTNLDTMSTNLKIKEIK